MKRRVSGACDVKRRVGSAGGEYRTSPRVSLRAEEALPRFTMPCLLFVGEADPRYPVVKECVGRMPNAIVVSFGGLDHLQGLQRSDLVLPHVKRFLANHA